MTTATTVHVPAAVWGLIFAAAVLAAILMGLSLLFGGRRRGRSSRGGYRVRVGPGLSVRMAAALARRMDTVLLTAVSLAFAVAVIINARS